MFNKANRNSRISCRVITRHYRKNQEIVSYERDNFGKIYAVHNGKKELIYSPSTSYWCNDYKLIKALERHHFYGHENSAGNWVFQYIR